MSIEVRHAAKEKYVVLGVVGLASVLLLVIAASLILTLQCGQVTEPEMQVRQVLMKQDPALLEDMLGQNPSFVRLKDDGGDSPLHWAVRLQCRTAIATLISRGADVNDRNADGQTPLYVAALKGRLECARRLLVARADPNIACNHGITPLHRAVESDNADMAILLLDNGANVKATTDLAETPVAWARRLGRKRIEALLIRRGAKGL